MIVAEQTLSDVRRTELLRSEDGRSILLVSDDAQLASRLRGTLVAAGFTVRTASPHATSPGFVQGSEHSLVLLDAAAGGTSSLGIVRRLCARSTIPVVVLSSCRDREELLEMLDSGADDYIGEPIDPDEVLARVRAVLRRCARGSGSMPQRLEIGALTIATKARSVRIHGEAIALTSVEYDVLECLARRAGRAVSRDELMAVVGRRHASPLDRSVDVHVSHLRRKLRQHGRQIRTIRGIGYLMADAE